MGYSSLPLVVVPHPVGDSNHELVTQRGVDIARECMRLLTTPAAELATELEARQHALPRAVMPR